MRPYVMVEGGDEHICNSAVSMGCAPKLGQGNIIPPSFAEGKQDSSFTKAGSRPPLRWGEVINCDL